MPREIEFAGYIEFLETFTYRKEDAINIPKEVRELAFSLQIDIEIVSTLGNDYKNYKCSPPSSFYGYAVLVFHGGYADIQVPINQARQRLYYAKNEAAYTQWESLHHHRQNRIYRNEKIVAFGTFWGAAGLEDYPLVAEACPLWLGFEELPLREIYVECAFGTQFRLHVSYWQPVIKALGDGCSYDAKSGQKDRDGDDNPDTDEEGLPDAGTQPQKASNPENPYAGLPDATSPFDEGNYSNSKIANTDNPNPDNEIPSAFDPSYPERGAAGTWQISGKAVSFCGVPMNPPAIFDFDLRGGSEDNPTVQPNIDEPSTECAGQSKSYITSVWGSVAEPRGIKMIKFSELEPVLSDYQAIFIAD